MCANMIGSRKDRHDAAVVVHHSWKHYKAIPKQQEVHHPALRKIIHTSKTLKTITNLLKSSHPRKVTRMLDCAKLKETAIIGGICHV